MSNRKSESKQRMQKKAANHEANEAVIPQNQEHNVKKQSLGPNTKR